MSIKKADRKPGMMYHSVSDSESRWDYPHNIPALQRMMKNEAKLNNANQICRSAIEGMGLTPRDTLEANLDIVLKEIAVLRKATNNIAKILQERGLLK